MSSRAFRNRASAKVPEPAAADVARTGGRMDEMPLGYARVSKGGEQTDALRAAGCRKLFEKAASSGRWACLYGVSQPIVAQHRTDIR